jgi:hypothetical protein
MSSVYTQAVDITSDYLGPAAERFIARQINFHLNIEPEKLSKADLPRLAEWVKVSIAVLTEDKAMVEEFGKRIAGIAENGAVA